MVSVAVGSLTETGWRLITRAETSGGDLVDAGRCADEYLARSMAEEVVALRREGVTDS